MVHFGAISGVHGVSRTQVQPQTQTIDGVSAERIKGHENDRPSSRPVHLNLGIRPSAVEAVDRCHKTCPPTSDRYR